MGEQLRKIRILGVGVDNLSRGEIEGWLEECLKDSPRQRFVTTLNPEIVLKGHRDGKYRAILNSADLNLCDGYGLKLIASLKNTPLKSRYTGARLAEFVIRKGKKTGQKILVISAKNSLSTTEEIVKAVAKKFGAEISVRVQDDPELFEREEAKGAEIILINFGAPDQEKFIYENRKKFPSGKLLAGVGGTFDFLTGKFRRAPKFMRKTGLEWLWRFGCEPKRVRRIINAVFVFPLKAALFREPQ